MNTQANNWSDSLTAMWAVFLAAIPRVVAFVLILLIGWFVAALIAKGVQALLQAVKFDEVAQRSGFTGFVQKMGVRRDASGFLSLLVKWFIRLIVLVVAFDALGLPAVSEVLRQLLLWLPNLVVAMIVLVVAGLLAKALAGLVRGATSSAGFANPDFLATVASTAVWAFAIVVAVNQLGIATTLVNTLFMAVAGAFALAAGLAFGLGGKDAAAQVIGEWRSRARDAKPKLEAAAQEVRQQHPMQQPPAEPPML